MSVISRVHGDDVSDKLDDNDDDVMMMMIIIMMKVLISFHSNSPVVGQLQGEAGMVSGFHGDDVSGKVRPQEQAESLDLIGFLGLAARQTELCELLIRSQHHQLWSKHHTETNSQQISC